MCGLPGVHALEAMGCMNKIKPKILHTRVVANCGGGPDKTILRQPKYMCKLGYDVEVAYIYPDRSSDIATIVDHAREHQCPIHLIPERSAIDLRTVRELIKLCITLKVDIWHSHDYKTDVLGLIVNRFYPMKLISTVHGFTRETWRTKLYSYLDDFSLRGYDRVLAVSEDLVEHCGAKGVKRDLLHLLPNAIDLNEYDAEMVTRNVSAQYGDKKLHLGIVGRLSKEKGIDRAVGLLHATVGRGHDVMLHIVGDGPEREKLEKLARDLGVQTRIVWWGWQDKPSEFLQRLDVLILTSHTEGLPNVLLEAMLMRVPIAATNVGGVKQLICDGEQGVLLDTQQKVDAWAEKIEPMLTDLSYRERLAECAYGHVREHYTFDQRLEKVAEIYREMLAA